MSPNTDDPIYELVPVWGAMTENSTCSKDALLWHKLGYTPTKIDADGCDLLKSTLRPAQDPELLAFSFKPTTASLLATTFAPARDWPKREAKRGRCADDGCFFPLSTSIGFIKRACATLVSKMCGTSTYSNEAVRTPTQPDVADRWSARDLRGQELHPHLCTSLSRATYYWGNQPGGIDVGFIMCEQGFDETSGQCYLKLVGREAEITDDGVQDVLDFVDTFTKSSSAERGFSISYDLRSFGIPTMALIVRVATWGMELDRRQRWEALNTSCQLVISPGWRLSVAKGLLTTFFGLCAPTCRTVLLTEENGVETEAAVWELATTADSGNPQG